MTSSSISIWEIYSKKVIQDEDILRYRNINHINYSKEQKVTSGCNFHLQILHKFFILYKIREFPQMYL